MVKVKKAQWSRERKGEKVSEKKTARKVKFKAQIWSKTLRRWELGYVKACEKTRKVAGVRFGKMR